MDITLIVNAGSSSLKLQLFNQEAESFWKSSINWSPQTQTIGDLQKLFTEQLTKELGAPIAINQINAVGQLRNHFRLTGAGRAAEHQEIAVLRRRLRSLQ